MSAEQSLDLNNLPSDVIREIIRVGHETTPRMRLISQRWNFLALNHVEHRSRLPSIKVFRWTVDGTGQIILTMRMTNEGRNYFGVEGWRWRLMRDKEPEYEVRHLVRIDYYGLPALLTPLFYRCSRIERLEIHVHDYRRSEEELERIREAMGDVLIEELELVKLPNLFQTPAGEVMELIRTCKVQHLVVSANIEYVLTRDTFECLIHRASRLVKTVELTAIDSLYNQPRNYCFVKHWKAIAGVLVDRAKVTATLELEDLTEMTVRMRIIASAPENAADEDVPVIDDDVFMLMFPVVDDDAVIPMLE